MTMNYANIDFDDFDLNDYTDYDEIPDSQDQEVGMINQEFANFANETQQFIEESPEMTVFQQNKNANRLIDDASDIVSAATILMSPEVGQEVVQQTHETIKSLARSIKKPNKTTINKIKKYKKVQNKAKMMLTTCKTDNLRNALTNRCTKLDGEITEKLYSVYHNDLLAEQGDVVAEEKRNMVVDELSNKYLITDKISKEKYKKFTSKEILDKVRQMFDNDPIAKKVIEYFEEKEEEKEKKEEKKEKEIQEQEHKKCPDYYYYIPVGKKTGKCLSSKGMVYKKLPHNEKQALDLCGPYQIALNKRGHKMCVQSQQARKIVDGLHEKARGLQRAKHILNTDLRKAHFIVNAQNESLLLGHIHHMKKMIEKFTGKHNKMIDYDNAKNLFLQKYPNATNDLVRKSYQQAKKLSTKHRSLLLGHIHYMKKIIEKSQKQNNKIIKYGKAKTKFMKKFPNANLDNALIKELYTNQINKNKNKIPLDDMNDIIETVSRLKKSTSKASKHIVNDMVQIIKNIGVDAHLGPSHIRKLKSKHPNMNFTAGDGRNIFLKAKKSIKQQKKIKELSRKIVDDVREKGANVPPSLHKAVEEEVERMTSQDVKRVQMKVAKHMKPQRYITDVLEQLSKIKEEEEFEEEEFEEEELELEEIIREIMEQDDEYIPRSEVIEIIESEFPGRMYGKARQVSKIISRLETEVMTPSMIEIIEKLKEITNKSSFKDVEIPSSRSALDIYRLMKQEFGNKLPNSRIKQLFIEIKKKLVKDESDKYTGKEFMLTSKDIEKRDNSIMKMNIIRDRKERKAVKAGKHIQPSKLNSEFHTFQPLFESLVIYVKRLFDDFHTADYLTKSERDPTLLLKSLASFGGYILNFKKKIFDSKKYKGFSKNKQNQLVKIWNDEVKKLLKIGNYLKNIQEFQNIKHRMSLEKLSEEDLPEYERKKLFMLRKWNRAVRNRLLKSDE